MGNPAKAASVGISRANGTQLSITARAPGSAGNAIFIRFVSNYSFEALNLSETTVGAGLGGTAFVNNPLILVEWGFRNPEPSFTSVINIFNSTSTLTQAALVAGSGSDLFDLHAELLAGLTAGNDPAWQLPPSPPILVNPPSIGWCELAGGADAFSDDNYKAKVMRHMLQPPWDKSFFTPMGNILTTIGGSDNDLGGLFGRDDFLPDEDV